jgi:hypothetical protein
MFGPVKPCRTVMPGFLAPPLVEFCRWFTDSECLFFNHNGSIVVGGNFVNEHVIISTGNMIDGRKSFYPVKQIFPVAEIPADPHIRVTGYRITQVLKGSMKCFKTNQFI